MKKLFTVILTLTLMAALCLTAAAADGEELMEYSGVVICEPQYALSSAVVEEQSLTQWTTDARCYKDTLSGKSLEIYGMLEKAFLEGTLPELSDDGFWRIGTISSDEWEEGIGEAEFMSWVYSHEPYLYTAVYAFTSDHPECFYINEGFGRSYGYSHSGSTIYSGIITLSLGAPSDWDSAAEISELEDTNNELAAVVNTIVSATVDMPTAARLAYFDNWLAANNDYNQEAADEGEAYGSDLPWSPLSAFTYCDEPVCEGYAKAFQLLCHEIGVPCLTVSGSAKGGAHMWTVVKLGDKWFFCDPTFDDPIYGNTGKTENFSDRTCFLTSQPNSHYADESILALPGLSPKAFFDAWELSGGCICGGETGSGKLLVTLYDVNGRMTDCGFGYSMYWKPGETMLIAPEFDAAKLLAADHAARFMLSGQNWRVLDEKIDF